MIAIVSEGRIDYGPAAWSANDIQRAMFRYGYTLQSGVFTAPGDEPAPFPAEEPQGPVGFSGCDMLPVVEVDEPAPEGKVLAWREPVILEDRVEMRPVWADAPALDAAKSVAVASVKAASASLTDYLWPRLKSEAVRLAVPPYDATTQAQYEAFVQETSLIQYEAASAIMACSSHAELEALLADLRAMYGDSLGV